MRLLLACFLLLFIWFSLYGQEHTEIDSLINVLNTTKNDKARVDILLRISSAYSMISPEKAMDYAKQGLQIAEKNSDRYCTGDCYIQIGNIQALQANNAEAIECFKRALKTFEEAGKSPAKTYGEEWEYKMGTAKCLFYIGSIGQKQGSLDTAIEYFFRSLKMYEDLLSQYKNQNEKEEIDVGLASCFMGIGLVHWDQGAYEKALEYFFKSLKINESIGNKNGILSCYNNIGCVYRDEGLYNKATGYYDKSLKICIESDYKRGMSLCYGNLGLVNMELGKGTTEKKLKKEYFDKAIEYFLKSMEISKKLGDKSVIAQNNILIGVLYSQLGEHKKAIESCTLGIELAISIGELNILKEAYFDLSDIYANAGDFRKAYDTHLLFSQLNDSLFKSNNRKRFAEMQIMHEMDNKEKKIQLLNKDKQIQESEIKKQTFLRNSFIIGFMLLLILAFLIFNRYQIKKKANNELAIRNQLILQQKNELEQKNELLYSQNTEIVVQGEEILSQRDELAIKNELLTHNNKVITDSIEYAKHIQEAILPDISLMKDWLIDAFLLFRPKDVVSGDFYWIYKTEDVFFIALADCTGHGVPGAFMSMIGNTLLNKIVIEKKILIPSGILNELHNDLLYSLTQSGKLFENSMDISLCRIDLKKRKATFSLANQRAYVIQGGTLSALSGSLFSTGEIFPKNHNVIFEDFEILLEKETTVYLLSDGYTDQYSETESKKFGLPRFEKILKEIVDLSIPEQRERLNSLMGEWIGKGKQTDDITVIGFKI